MSKTNKPIINSMPYGHVIYFINLLSAWVKSRQNRSKSKVPQSSHKDDGKEGRHLKEVARSDDDENERTNEW